jgi:hypothetical protein
MSKVATSAVCGMLEPMGSKGQQLRLTIIRSLITKCAFFNAKCSFFLLYLDARVLFLTTKCAFFSAKYIHTCNFLLRYIRKNVVIFNS